MLSNEERAVARLALRNQFWLDFSKLVKAYIDGIGGTEEEVEQQVLQMGDMTSIYGVHDNPKGGWSISFTIEVSFAKTRGIKLCKTMMEALETPNAYKVFLQGQLCATKKKDGWHFEV